MLELIVKTKPITYFFKIIRVLFFYVDGGYFRISVNVKNHGKVRFQGGDLTIHVKYAFGQFLEEIKGHVGSIEPGETIEAELEGTKWGVVGNGHALFLANVLDDKRDSIPICDKNGKTLQLQQNRYRENISSEYHVYTFHAFSIAEFFALTAINITSLVFIANLLLTVYLNWDNLSSARNFIVDLYESYWLLWVPVAIVAWIAFVYYFYDHYGLGKG